MEINQRNCIRA